MESSLHLRSSGPRHSGFTVLSNTNIDEGGVKALDDATRTCWDAIVARDLQASGHYFRKSFEAQIAMFPNMMSNMVQKLIRQYQDVALGWKLSGAGGGG